MSGDLYSYGATIEGYHCPNCNQWVSIPHYCNPQPSYYGGYPFNQLITIDGETKDILRRIADALEKLVEKQGE